MADGLTKAEEHVVTLTGIDRAAFLRTKRESDPAARQEFFETVNAAMQEQQPAEKNLRPAPVKQGETVVILGPIEGLKPIW